MLVSPVESSWEILKALLSKAAIGQPPDDDEKRLILSLLNLDPYTSRSPRLATRHRQKGLDNIDSQALKIISHHTSDVPKFLRVTDIIRNYSVGKQEDDWEKATNEKPAIEDAVMEDGTPLLNPAIKTAFMRAVHTSSEQ